MLTIPQIAAALRTTRAEFARLYLQAQLETSAPDRIEFQAKGTQSDNVQAFISALEYAQTKGWLTALLELVVGESLENGQIAAALAASNVQGDAQLQAMLDTLRGFLEPDLMARGVTDAMRWIAKVSFNGSARGTGFLIRPHLMMTAWHVLRDAFEEQPDGNGGGTKWVPKADAGAQITFEFDDVLLFVRGGKPFQYRAGTPVNAAKDWHVCSSPCHPEEVLNRVPVNRADLNGHWDYVVVRIASAAGLERRWGLLDERSVVPSANQTILVFQHPAGQPLKFDQFTVGSAADFGAQPPFQDLRFIHFANAVGGSSGGPCFDRSFSLFGIHQGGWPLGPPKGRANRGVPITHILRHIESQGPLPEPRPEDMPVWRLGVTEDHAPVLGVEDFQRLIWDAALRLQPRILLISGARESGKSFLLKLLHVMLPDRLHLKIELAAEEIAKADTRTFVATFCKAASLPEPTLMGAADVNSSAAVYRKDEVLTQLMDALDRARAGRTVWITIMDMNKVEVDGQDARELLLLLYTQARTSPWLRIVLDGFRADMPAEVASVLDAHVTKPVTGNAVEKYLKRFAAEYALPIDPQTSTALGPLLADRYRVVRDGLPATNVRALATDVMQFVAKYLHSAPASAEQSENG